MTKIKHRIMKLIALVSQSRSNDCRTSQTIVNNENDNAYISEINDDKDYSNPCNKCNDNRKINKQRK